MTQHTIGTFKLNGSLLKFTTSKFGYTVELIQNNMSYNQHSQYLTEAHNCFHKNSINIMNEETGFIIC